MPSAQDYPLLIIAPQIGAVSETFIRRHMTELLPGKTAVIAAVAGRQHEVTWSVPGLVFDTNHSESNALRRAARWGARQVNFSPLTEKGRAKAFIRKHGVQVAMAEYLDIGAGWLDVFRELGIPFYGHAHGADVSALLREEKWRRAYRGYAEAAGVITVSHFTRQRLIELGLPAEKIHVIPCGVELPESVAQQVDRLPVRCLAVGRMVSKKAPILLLDAFRRALELFPDLYLDFVGGGPLLPSAQHFIHAFGLQDRVHLHGAQPHAKVGELLRNADLFIQHSVTDRDTGDEEGLPVGILEAMAHGLPIAATTHTGIPEAVEEGRSGLLVEEGDTVAMARCIAELARDPQCRRQFGQAARERIRTEFTWKGEREALRRLLQLTSPA